MFSLEVEPAFTGGIGKGGDTAMVEIAGAVEGDFLDALGQSFGGEVFADFGGGFHIGAVGELQGNGGRGHEGRSLGVVDDLGFDVLVGAEDAETRLFRGPFDLGANASVLADANLGSGFFFDHGNQSPYFLDVAAARLPSLRMMTSPLYLMPLPP